MRPGLWQILIVVLIIALVFGAKKIPEIARALGRSSGEFKKGLKEGNDAAVAKAEELKKDLLDDTHATAEPIDTKPGQKA